MFDKTRPRLPKYEGKTQFKSHRERKREMRTEIGQRDREKEKSNALKRSWQNLKHKYGTNKRKNVQTEKGRKMKDQRKRTQRVRKIKCR